MPYLSPFFLSDRSPLWTVCAGDVSLVPTVVVTTVSLLHLRTILHSFYCEMETPEGGLLCVEVKD